MKILVLPQDANPYQEQLYGPMRAQGVRVTYLQQMTGSRTLNLLLLPLETLVRASRGWRIVHVHWVFGFAWPGSRTWPALRAGAELWFRFWLWAARRGGLRVVWTAHNALPHDPVFADDSRARRALAKASDAIILHSMAAEAELRRVAPSLPDTAIIPLGPFPEPSDGWSRALSADDVDGRLRLLLFGQLRSDKGPEDLLEAVEGVAADVEVTIAGACPDARLAARIQASARRQRRVDLRLGFLSDRELGALIDRSHVIVLPFRHVTTTGSAVLALQHRRGLLLPDLPALAGLPEGAVVRYDGSVLGLRSAIEELAASPSSRLVELSSEASRYADSAPSWDDIAGRTLRIFHAGADVSDTVSPRP